MKIDKKVLVTIFSFFALANASFIHAASFTEEDLVDVNRISRLVGKDNDADMLSYLKTKIDSSNEVVAAIAATALYVHDQKAYKDQFFDAMAVNDYAERKKGNYNMVPLGVMQQLLHAIDQRAKGDKDDERIIILIDFMDLKTKNMWIDMMGEKTSLARFLRGLYLRDCLKSTGIDTEKLANQIDKHTQNAKT